jgi:hypothetical protein
MITKLDHLAINNITKWLNIKDIANLRLSKKLNRYLTRVIINRIKDKKYNYESFVNCPWPKNIQFLEIELRQEIMLSKELKTLNLIPVERGYSHIFYSRIENVNIFSLIEPKFNCFKFENVVNLDIDVKCLIKKLNHGIEVLSVGAEVRFESHILPDSLKSLIWKTRSSDVVYLNHMVKELTIVDGTDIILHPKIYDVLNNNCYRVERYRDHIYELFYHQEYFDENFKCLIHFSSFIYTYEDIKTMLYNNIGIYQ